MEPRIVDGRLVLVGMPGTVKFRDLARDARFCLHTATIDPHVGDGDVKLWGVAQDVQDPELHELFAEKVFAEAGLDLRGQQFRPFYVGALTGASSLHLEDGQLTITIWKPGRANAWSARTDCRPSAHAVRLRRSCRAPRGSARCTSPRGCCRTDRPPTR